MVDWQQHANAASEGNKIAQAEFQRYAAAATERNETAQAIFRIYADQAIARNDRASADFRQYARTTAHPPSATKPISHPTGFPKSGLACDPVTLRRGGSTYMSSYVPTMAVCLSCYASHVEPSPLASYFTLKELSPKIEHTCDMSATAIQTAWLRCCARLRHGNLGTAEQVVVIDDFAQDFKRINYRIQYLIPGVTRLKKEIQEARTQFIHKDLGSARLLPALEPMGLSSAGSMAQHAAIAGYVASSDTNGGLAQKQAEMVRLRTELRGLLGVPDTTERLRASCS